MLYYQFLKDKKVELSQVLIATQSTTKGSKRVRLDISIQVDSFNVVMMCSRVRKV